MGFVGSMVAQSFFSAMGGFGADDPAPEENAGADEAQAEGDPAADDYGDGGDFGGDDFGGGDFEV